MVIWQDFNDKLMRLNLKPLLPTDCGKLRGRRC